MSPRLRRVLAASGVVGLVAVGAAIAAPALLSGPLRDLLVDQINQRFQATVEVDGVQASLFRDFPSASLRVDGLRVVGTGPFADQELFAADTLDVAVNLASLRGGPLEITAVRLTKGRLSLVTDAQGRSNTDLSPASEQAPGPAPELWLRALEIDGLDVSVRDEPGGLDLSLLGLSTRATASVGGDALTTTATATARELDVTQGGLRLLRDVQPALELDLTYAPAAGAVTFRSSRVTLNALSVGFDGSVTPTSSGTDLDLRFAADQASFKELLSLVPEAYTAEFAQVQASGGLTLKGGVQGTLPDVGDDLPGFNLTLAVVDGTFRYPDLPVGAQGIRVDARVLHPGGSPDLIKVEVPAFALSLDGSPLKGAMQLTRPVSDPHIDLSLDGTLDLGRLRSALPGDPLGITGKMAVDLRLDGAVSDFEAVRTDAVVAQGTLTLVDGVYTAPELPLPIRIDRMSITLDPRRLDLANLDLTFGQSDLAIRGEVDNVVAFALQDAVLRGRFALTSRRLDARPFEGDPDAPPSDESSVVAVPAGYDLAFDLDLASVKSHDYDLERVRGTATMKGHTVRLDRLRARTWGGEITLDGTYTAPTDAWADLDMDVEADRLKVSDTLASVETARRMVPIAEKSNGRVETRFHLNSRLDRELTPDPATLAAAGLLTASQLNLSGGLLDQVAAFTGNAKLGALSLERRPFTFEVASGTLRLPEVPISAGPASGVLRGRTGVVDSTLDLKLDLSVPARQITGGPAARLIGGAVKTVGLTADIGGTWTAPKVTVRLSDDTRDQALDVAEELVGGKVDEAVAAARVQGDRLIAEAERQADKVRAAAKVAADTVRDTARDQAAKLKKKAKGNPLKELAAREASERLVEQADKQAKKLVREADEQADRLIAEARKQKDKLIDDAARRAGR